MSFRSPLIISPLVSGKHFQLGTINIAKNISILYKELQNIFDFCLMMMSNAYLVNNARAWVKRKNCPDEVIRIVLDLESKDAELCYRLFTAYDEKPDYMGRILFDAQGFWIYDGDILIVAEQEQVAKFIINYVEVL
jgi:hypothetical protein